MFVLKNGILWQGSEQFKKIPQNQQIPKGALCRIVDTDTIKVIDDKTAGAFVRDITEKCYIRLEFYAPLG